MRRHRSYGCARSCRTVRRIAGRWSIGRSWAPRPCIGGCRVEVLYIVAVHLDAGQTATWVAGGVM